MKIGIVAPSPGPVHPWRRRAGVVVASHGDRRADAPRGRGREAPGATRPTLSSCINGYRAFAALDVSHFDRVISVEVPGMDRRPPDHIVWMFHPLRGLYDTYHLFG